MSDAAIAIPNLLYRYADAIDAGRFDDAAAMFAHGEIVAGGERLRDTAAMVAMWRRWIRLYADGTPRTRHITTNPIIELSDDANSAHCRSRWTLLQATDEFPLQVVATGHYDDRFEQVDGCWRFAERIYDGVDLAGDTSAHMLLSLNHQGL